MSALIMVGLGCYLVAAIILMFLNPRREYKRILITALGLTSFGAGILLSECVRILAGV